MHTCQVLIAGITGFLGSQLARSLASNSSYKVVGLHRTQSNLQRLSRFQELIELHNVDIISVNDLFQNNSITVVVNCLADYGKSKNPSALLEANVRLPLKLLEQARQSKTKLFINAGTSLPQHLNNYALAKYQFTQWMEVLASDITAINLKLEHFYGAGESTERFISYVISRLLEPAKTLKLTLGEQIRDFIHINDVVTAIKRLIDLGVHWDSGLYQLPLGSGNGYVVREVVELIRQLTQNRSTVIEYGALPYRSGEVMYSKADIQGIMNLGWAPRINLQEGLRKAIKGHLRLIRQRIAG